MGIVKREDSIQPIPHIVDMHTSGDSQKRVSAFVMMSAITIQ